MHILSEHSNANELERVVGWEKLAACDDGGVAAQLQLVDGSADVFSDALAAVLLVVPRSYGHAARKKSSSDLNCYGEVITLPVLRPLRSQRLHNFCGLLL
jgi:hypothetical protein